MVNDDFKIFSVWRVKYFPYSQINVKKTKLLSADHKRATDTIELLDISVFLMIREPDLKTFINL